MSDHATETITPNKIRAMADNCKATAERLTAEIEAAPTRAEQKKLRQRRHSLRILERWCRSRAGYL